MVMDLGLITVICTLFSSIKPYIHVIEIHLYACFLLHTEGLTSTVSQLHFQENICTILKPSVIMGTSTWIVVLCGNYIDVVLFLHLKNIKAMFVTV